jgi:hypothetical protein
MRFDMESTLKKSVASIYESINDADKYFYESIYSHDEEGYSIGASEYYLKHAFVELLMILDHKGFEKTHSEVSELFVKAKNGKGGITKMEMGPHDPYLAWSGVIRPYVASLANIYNIEADEASIPTALIEVIRHSAYSINDKSIFVESPKNEREMHNRIEGIIRCIYPDMIHEPSLAKQIKNFKPDTGIPSIKTLIEYKFITNKTEAKRVADEILADTRGYKSKEWSNYSAKKSLTVFFRKKVKTLRG